MKKVMKTSSKVSIWIARAFLGFITAAIPVFIAACYGSPIDGDIENSILATGRVLSSATGKGIADIYIRCVRSTIDGGMTNDGGIKDTEKIIYEATSLPGDGAWEIWYPADKPCDRIIFEDQDKEENGGMYLTKSVPFDPNADETVVKLDQVVSN